MIFKLSDLRKAFLYFVQGPKFYGGGGAPPTQSTVTNQATIPDELKPYIDSYMKQAEQQLYNKDAEGNITGLKPYIPYGQSTDPVTGKVTQDAYKGIAAFDPLQTQAYKGAAGLSTGDSFNQAKTGALASGQGMYGSAGTALGYGQQGQGIGQQAANIGQQGQTIGQRGADLSQQGLNNAASVAVQQTERAGALGQRAEQLGNEGLVNAANATALQVARADQYGTAASRLGTQGAANAAAQAGSQISSASGYGASGTGFGATAAGRARQGYDAQAEFANQITSPGTTATYMSPYMQDVVNQQIGAANRAYDITGAQQMGQATKANAFGGSREALMAAENERARNTAIGDIQAKGSQEAFVNAQAQQQFGANLGIAGLGAGVSASQAGIQGAQAGLQGVGAQTAASNMQLQGVQAGIQGQQAGIQSVGAQTSASNMALDGYKNALAGNAQGLEAVRAQTATANMALDAYKNALAGNAQNLQGNQQNLQGNQQNLAGINTALQGVQGAQTGYAGVNAAAGTMGNLAGQDISAQQSILKAQADAGALVRAREQAAKDQSILDYTNQQNFPMQGIGTMSNLVRGIGTNNSSATTYAPAPSAMSQVGGLVATGIGAYGALKANGGVIEDKGYANGGIVGYAAGGSVEGSMRSKLEDLDTARLQAIIKENESPEMTKIAKEVMRSNYAKGGIVAFAEGGQPAASWLSQLEAVSQEMKAKAYKLHGWTDEDVANYQSSKRVPLDPSKGLAQIPGESTTVNTNKEPLRSTRFTPEETAPYESSIESGKELSTKVKTPWAPEETMSAKEFKAGVKSVGNMATKVAGKAVGGFGTLELAKQVLDNAVSPSEVDRLLMMRAEKGDKEAQSVLDNGGINVFAESIKKPIREGSVKFAKWMDTPIVGGNKGIAAVETPTLVEPKKIEPMSAPTPMAQMQNETQTQTARPSVPAQEGRNATSVMNQGTTAQANAPAQSEDSGLSRLQASRDSAQADANMSVEDRVKQQKALEEKFVGKDEETAAYRKSIMDERANAPDEARRQMSMRLMEFGANWASTPGAPLVAGMKALTSTLPSIMSDAKENKKMMKDLDKSEYLLNHATRLEELGHLKEASAAKDKASELVMKHEDALVTYGLKQQEIQSAEKIAKLQQFGATTRTSMEQEGRSDPRAVTPTGRLASIDRELADLSRDKTGSPNPAKFKYTQEQLDTIAKLKRERAELRGDRPQYQAPRPNDPERIRELGDKSGISREQLVGR